jgi:glycine/D-amino acid oxidase-like deaminating enzyme
VSAARSAIVIGAGIFGVTTAIELRRRGWAVTLTDPGPLPHPDAASTDVSKAIRMDYGSDEHYMEMMEEAWILQPGSKRRPAGFIRGRDLREEELSGLMADLHRRE